MDREPEAPEVSWWDEARAIARRHARGASDAADDLAQELAVAALERGAVTRPGAWLERVGRNAAIDRWRVEHRRVELAGEIAAPAAPPDPETRVLARERRGILRGALAALPRPLRRAALARFHADLSFEAVAARLGTEPVTARTRVHRALARLRARVGGLRALLAWMPGAQATALGLTLVLGVASPGPSRAPAVAAPSAAVAHTRRLAETAPATSRAVPAPAAAPTRAAPRRASSPARVEPPPVAAVQRFSYDDDEIAGDLQGPDDVPIVGEPATAQPSLIELRRHFVPELVKSLEDL